MHDDKHRMDGSEHRKDMRTSRVNSKDWFEDDEVRDEAEPLNRSVYDEVPNTTLVVPALTKRQAMLALGHLLAEQGS